MSGPKSTEPAYLRGYSDGAQEEARQIGETITRTADEAEADGPTGQGIAAALRQLVVELGLGPDEQAPTPPSTLH